MNNTVKLDHNGIKIGNRYRTLLCSSLFYFRQPVEVWDDRMRLLKAAGYNCIDVYCPWNYHETEPGVWDFSGQRDVDHFLSLAEANGLYVIVRPGPYICSEWDGGGLPGWLNLKSESIRQDDGYFLSRIGEWYCHILPVVRTHQITQGGTVILMQVENELDFFPCISPQSYVSKLKDMIRCQAIDVPLFCCCGQNSLERSGALEPGLEMTYNVYSDDSDDALEERVLKLQQTVAGKDRPLMISETNREHRFIKRLYACGAKLISPYNQCAGTTGEFCNGLTNWGSPVALMSSDYDFDSMITSTGEVRKSEFNTARVFSMLLSFMGESGAKGKPARFDNCLQDGKPMTGLMTEKGNLLLAVNCSDIGITSCIEIDGVSLSVRLEPFESRLIANKLIVCDSLSIEYSSLEFITAEKEDGKTVLYFVGEDVLQCRINVNGKSSDLTVKSSFDEQMFSIRVSSVSEISLSGLGVLPPLSLSSSKGECHITMLDQQEIDTHVLVKRERDVMPMEMYGQYRGTGIYTITSDHECSVLLCNVSDIIRKRSNGQFEKTWYADGSCCVDNISAGTTAYETEIWGHSNFNDIRRPSLQMSSLKGISSIIEICERQDISKNWTFDFFQGESGGKTYFFTPSPYHPVANIDGYQSDRRPFDGVFHKYLEPTGACDSLFLWFEKANAIISVYINGKFAGMLDEGEHYFDISSVACSGAFSLDIRTTRINCFYQIGRVELVYGKRIKECVYSTLEKRSGRSIASDVVLPCAFKYGEERMLRIPEDIIPDDDVRVKFKGRNMHLTVYHGDKCIGRLLVGNTLFPPVKGGAGDELTLVRQWFCDNLPITIHAQAFGEDSMLEDMIIHERVNPLSGHIICKKQV